MVSHEGTPALTILDVEGMQSYNNTYGMSEGDELLRLVSSTLVREFGEGRVMRAMDDHFLVLSVIEGLEQRLSAVNDLIRSKSTGNTTGLKGGIYEVSPGDRAITALDHAKRAMREVGNDLNHQYAVYDPEMENRYWRERYVVETFHDAVEKGCIVPFFQPIVDLSTGEAVSYEALARWIDSNGQPMLPVDFIPALEKYHLLHVLDLHIADQVCMAMEQRRAAGSNSICVSINISPQDFDHANIASELTRIADEHGIPHSDLAIEVTEQALPSDTDVLRDEINELRRRGFRVYVDDFGSGYSSLNVLGRYSFDLLKIDRDLVIGVDEENSFNSIAVEGIVRAASRLGLEVLAEGIENVRQADFLRSVGCGRAQGYHFGYPNPQIL